MLSLRSRRRCFWHRKLAQGVPRRGFVQVSVLASTPYYVKLMQLFCAPWVERVYKRCRSGRAQGTERGGWGNLSPHHSGNFSSCKKAPESWGKVTCNSPQDLIMTKPSFSCSKQMCRSKPWTSLSPLICVALNANLSCSFPASLRKANHFLNPQLYLQSRRGKPTLD